MKNRAKELETNQEPEVKQDPPQQPLVPVEAPPNVQEEDEDDMPLTALVPADPAAVSDAVVPSVSDAVVPYNPVVCTGSWYEELPASWEIRKIEKSLVNFHNQSSAGFLASPCAASSSILYLIDLVYLVGRVLQTAFEDITLLHDLMQYRHCLNMSESDRHASSRSPPRSMPRLFSVPESCYYTDEGPLQGLFQCVHR